MNSRKPMPPELRITRLRANMADLVVACRLARHGQIEFDSERLTIIAAVLEQGAGDLEVLEKLFVETLSDLKRQLSILTRERSAVSRATDTSNVVLLDDRRTGRSGEGGAA
jgi:hypothetical protein